MSAPTVSAVSADGRFAAVAKVYEYALSEPFTSSGARLDSEPVGSAGEPLPHVAYCTSGVRAPSVTSSWPRAASAALPAKSRVQFAPTGRSTTCPPAGASKLRGISDPDRAVSGNCLVTAVCAGSSQRSCAV